MGRYLKRRLESLRDRYPHCLASVRGEFLATPVYSVSTLLSVRLKALSDAIPGVRSMVLLDADGTVVASSVDSLLGRDFSDRDTEGAPPVMIVSASVAQKFWPGENPIGKRITGEDVPKPKDWMTVIGVVSPPADSGWPRRCRDRGGAKAGNPRCER
jgi:hypothetical protein